MLRFAFCLLFLLIPLTPLFLRICPGLAQTPSAVTGFSARFKKTVTENKIPGAAYALLEHGKIRAIGTYGTRRIGKDLPVTEETVFRLASVSKTFTADLTALLVEEGKLSWDDRLVDFVPDFRLKTEGSAQKITVSHLLSHSSGLIPNAYDLMLEDGWPIKKIIPRFKDLKPLCSPGKCYGYQNVMFSLIQPVIEQSTGTRFETLMENHLFRPLGLKTASIGLTPFKKAANHADPHQRVKKRWVPVQVDAKYYTVAPAAGVNASILDLAKWLRAQMGYNKEVLDDTVLDTVTRKRVATRRELYRKGWKRLLSKAYYGYGWRIYRIKGREIILHAGGVKGFRSLIAYSKELDLGLAILMNAGTRSIHELGAGFWADLFLEAPASAMANRQLPIHR